MRRVHPRIGLRDSDVILASYPKSGNTWMRFIWANLVSELELGGREVDFHLLNGEMICDHNRHLYGGLEYHSLPRLVKTHQPFDARVFRGNRILYLHRHPCDVMESYHAFRFAKLRRSRVTQLSLSQFIRDEKYGIPAWGEHVRSWLPNATVVSSYEALREHTASEVSRILSALEIPGIGREAIEDAVKRASLANVRRLEERSGRPDQAIFEDGFRFTRRGEVGGWRSAFDRANRHWVRTEIERLSLSDRFAV
ncbi:MAG: sulfotransferase domain-containing protein [Myxococcota bacterium]